MDKNQELDEMDRLLLEYYKNKRNSEYIVPPSTQKVAQSFIKKVKMKNAIRKFNKVAAIFITIGVMTTGIVFAKDIVNFITSLFTNSTPAIDTAVENGYVQNIDMDYVYCNNIGVKVEALVIDDFNLDISFIYESNVDNIKEMKLEEYVISTGNNNLIYDSSHSINDKLNIANGMSRNGQILKVNNNTYKESILFNLTKTKQDIHSINIDIKKLKVKKEDNTSDYISGNWTLNINLDETMKNRENILYDFIDNDNVDVINAEMSATEFVIKVKLKIPIPLEQFYEGENFTLENNSSEKFVPYFIENGNIDLNTNMEVGMFTIYYDNVNIYTENIDELKLNIKTDKNNIFIINLCKKLVD